ncbi:Murein L,D-transpeptidase YafK [Devosia lucknowensis]|uniref:Murein L,D-transpeptidase YafK n=1 Tax=Devosia lucknowensis TaxID=1096929 RepID=A0A1Y6F130_9HYPH|nr:murein L,D-transpeptidase family protein [Devosia lucknowensis]SMQ68575.1 Murein L,D-transpeptidase YafK [Devosia lucknowensis]
MLARFINATAFALAVLVLAGCSQFVGDNRHNVPLPKALVDRMAQIGSSPAQPMMIRVFKESSELEVWKRTGSGQYALLKIYPICKWSGALGPKVKEGDYQSPEGFYDVTPAMMNPKSSYYLSFNVGFPNKFDQAWGRTGSYLMIHGDCLSVGCYAMTDDGIKEIYAMVRESFKGGNGTVPLQLLPFRMTEANLARHAASPHAGFWRNLKEGTDLFDAGRVPPRVDVCERRYVFNRTNPGDAPLPYDGACPVISYSTMAVL